LLYSVVLVSAVQQCESAIIIHTHTHIYIYSLRLEPASPSPPHPLGCRSTRLNSPCPIAASHQPSVLHVVVCMCHRCSLSSCPPLLLANPFSGPWSPLTEMSTHTHTHTVQNRACPCERKGLHHTGGYS